MKLEAGPHRSLFVLSILASACGHPASSVAPTGDAARSEPSPGAAGAAEAPKLEVAETPRPSQQTLEAKPQEEVWTTPAPAPAVPAPAVQRRLKRYNERSSLGTNLTMVRDYASEWPFVDVFKKSRDWISGAARQPGRRQSGPWVNKEPLDLDEDGWIRSLRPGQVARSLMFWSDGGGAPIVYPKGEYVVLWEGKGELEYANAEVVDSRPGRQVIRVDPAKGGFGLTITATDPKDYVRNIHVIMPGGVCSNDGYRACGGGNACESGGTCVPFERNFEEQIFHPTFLERTKTYSTLRFMDWMATNNSLQRDWNDRPKLTDARWSVKGVPLEVIADLANRLSADAWVNVPHLATPEYILEMAKLLAATLDPDRRVYVEHSNEVWNNGFEQARWARARGAAEHLGGNDMQAATRWHSKRSVEAFKIFEEVFPKARLERVMGSFIAMPRASDELLSFEKAYEHTDALAIAAYFDAGLGNPRDQDRARLATLDTVFKEVEGPQFEKIGKWFTEQAGIARKYKIDLVAYEGGEHFAGVGEVQRDPVINELFDAVGRDPRIKGTYLAFLAMWKEKGGRLFMHFVNCAQPSRYGRFGALEQLEQPRKLAPKFDALQEFIEKNPRWW